MATPELNREATALAHRLAEEGRPLDVCVAIADAMVDISRVRRHRHQIIDHALEVDRAAWPLSLDEDAEARQAQVVAGLGPELQRLDRYERRAFSKRRSALRALLAAQSGGRADGLAVPDDA